MVAAEKLWPVLLFDIDLVVDLSLGNLPPEAAGADFLLRLVALQRLLVEFCLLELLTIEAFPALAFLDRRLCQFQYFVDVLLVVFVQVLRHCIEYLVAGLFGQDVFYIAEGLLLPLSNKSLTPVGDLAYRHAFKYNFCIIYKSSSLGVIVPMLMASVSSEHRTLRVVLQHMFFLLRRNAPLDVRFDEIAEHSVFVQNIRHAVISLFG